MPRSVTVGLLALALVGAACGGSGSGAGTAGNVGGTSLRALAARRDLLVGAAVAVDPLANEPQYRQVLAREYNAATPENAMKWALIQPEEGRYDFKAADRIVKFAEAHRMVVRGHTLVWYRQLPDWVTTRAWTKPALERALHDHIQTVVGHYKGRVAQWDVVNEALANNGSLRDNVFLRVIGPEYIDLAFKWAHAADPSALLFYNDYDLELPGPKTRAAHALITSMHNRGVPIDGVGIQSHDFQVRARAPRRLRAALDGFAALGLDVAVTELDVPLQLPATPGRLEAQATIYRQVLDACLAVKRCHTFVTWGFTDKHSWVPGEYPGFGAALPFDAQYRPKPAYAALRAGLRRRLG